MSLKISVIICTHEPRYDYLDRTLESLKHQSLAFDEWELLVIDNASSTPVDKCHSLNWHPRAKHLKEQDIGKTKAVLLGIKESTADLIILVDDDNILYPDYLEKSLEIYNQWPGLGTWGGSTIAEYESNPPAWLKSYECYLSVRQIKKDYWLCLTDSTYYGLFPYGAGLCVRRNVAEAYYRQLQVDPMRKEFDRKGDSLVSSGDTDLVLAGCDMGMGTGVFTNLNITHLIHTRRTTESYLAKMLNEMTYSCVLLAAKRGQRIYKPSTLTRIWGNINSLRKSLREWRFYHAVEKGTLSACKTISTWPSAK